ncbi:hypothetical protein H6G89_18225 [Oscillatoria sp. FACHB-1407]|uniref:hypothetical protein n=1 Tax=Oscillatoria sp. FACHB-1407 TaxID=2692847 RepID=UPI00168369A7|nr:hypothetical protein [Oscillatoria sp. FACHB-1407]MBD2462980.1 hypothetical protein [Oscillatoria sp. FACHB-1407]
MSIGSNADKKDLEGNLDPEVEAQRDLVANAAIDPQPLFAKEADPFLADAPTEQPMVDNSPELQGD